MSLDTISGVLRAYWPPIVFPSLAMMSWELLRNLIVFWRAIDNPLFVRETNHPPMWFPYYARLSRATGLALMLGGMLCYLGTILVLFLNNLLILVIPVLMFWTVLTSITLAPVVVGERERGTWDTLRTTPLDIETILLGKAGGALWWQRDMLRAMIGLLVLFAVGVGLLSLILVPTSDDTAHLPEMLLCGAAILMPAVIALVFIFDRAQHFVLTAICVLGISASARSGRVALASAVVVSLLLWLVDVGIAGLLLAVQPGRATLTAETDWLVLAGLGPVVGYLSALPLGKMAVYVAGTLIVRELLVRAAWAWARHLAQGE